MLADIARVNVMEYFDEEGAFDVARARADLPGWCVQEITIEETARSDRQGNETMKRKIRVHFPDKLKALDMDSALAGHKKDTEDEESADQRREKERAQAEADELARQILKEMLLTKAGAN